MKQQLQELQAALQLLHELVPTAAVVAIIVNPNNPQADQTVSRLTPVALPPGRLSAATAPVLTGSSPVLNTIGIVAVAALAAAVVGPPPTRMIAATPSRS
jgi:hypothetical protein